MNPQQESLFRQQHAQGALNRQLAQQFGMSEATVKRWKKTLGLGSNCPRNNLGQRGVDLFIQEAQAHGLQAVDVSAHRNPFDVQVGAVRVEVKTARLSNDSWRYRLPNMRNSFHNTARRTKKDYVQDCDLMALIALDRDDQLAFVHLRQPDREKNVVIRAEGFTGRNNWELLTELLIAEAA